MTDYNVDEVLKQFFDPNDPNWKPSDKIPLIDKEIEIKKNDLKTFLVSSDYNIADLLLESEDICSESNLLSQDLETCKKEIEEETMAEIVKSIENYNTLSKELQSVTFATNLIGDVIQCGRYIKEYEEGREAKSYTKSMEAVCDLVQYLELPTDGFDYLEIASKTREAAQLIQENLSHELYTEWTRAIHWSIKATPRKTIVAITITLNDSSTCFDVINALEICNKLPEKITEFAEFLMKEVLKPILYNECTVFANNDELAEITIMHKANKPNASDVIDNYRCLFMYLGSKLGMEYKRGVSLMTRLGKKISLEFSELLIKDCLIHTVPNNIMDLQTYGQVTKEIESFQKFLVDIKFFPKDDSISILTYIEDIDELFAERSSEYFLETARTIMLIDLSLSMSIGVETIPDDSTQSASTERSEALKILEKTLPKSLFYFPRCMISKSAQELLDLVFMIMEQAVQCPAVVCRKLYTTTRLIFELYDAIVPYHHENYLQTIPQYVALFHNNCMYLAHNLQTLGDKWLTLMEARRVDYPISFVDLVQKLRDLGHKHLSVHLQQQRKQVLDNIRSSDLNCIVVKDVLGDNAEAAVRQCLRQLQLLKNVWIGVFPYNVFTRLIATLVNMFVDELIHRVCTVEDISMEMATQLTDIYSLVVQKAPHLFQNPKDIERHVKSWIKLQELIFVLGGTLKDIENHWNDGRGPLAVHFRTEELRSLIKALFQNTQIRANLLSKIK